jgi:hypothetical protein
MTDEWKISDNSETLKRLDKALHLLEGIHIAIQKAFNQKTPETLERLAEIEQAVRTVQQKQTEPNPPTEDRPVRFANVYDDGGIADWHKTFESAVDGSGGDDTDDELVCRFVVYESGSHEVIPRDVTEWPVKAEPAKRITGEQLLHMKIRNMDFKDLLMVAINAMPLPKYHGALPNSYADELANQINAELAKGASQ